MPPISATHVTPHFTRRELRYDATPAEYRANLEATAWELEQLRTAGGNGRLLVTSAWRSAEENAELPTAAFNSQHLTAEAFDFRPLDMSVEQLLRNLEASGYALDQAQLIAYPLGDDHLHYGRARPYRTPDVVLFHLAGAGYTSAPLPDSSRTYAQLRARRATSRLGVLVAIVALGLLAWALFRGP